MKLSPQLMADVAAEHPDMEGALGATPGILASVLARGLFVLLAFGVLAFGAVHEWSTFAFETGSVILFLLWAGTQVASGKVMLSNNPLYLPASFFFILILVQIGFRTTAYGYVSKYAVLHYVSYGIVLLVAAECVREEDARKQFALALIVFGTLYAFFALAQEMAPNGRIFWFYKPSSYEAVYGSYINHNHYAGVMEMLVPVPLVVCMGHLLKGGKRALVAFCAVLMASTIFLSRSRGGMIAFGLQIVLFAALTLVQRRNTRVAIGLIAVSFLILGFLFFIGKGQVLGRLADLAPGIRWNMTKDSFEMFAHRPVLGWGLGTFPTVYPTYRTFYTNLFINQAHNDYAQLLVETGLLGFTLMLWFLICLYRRGLPTSRRWEFKWDGALSLAALLGCSGILFHSFVDFNLQIPANAAFFYVLCALAASKLPSQWSRSSRARSRQSASIGELAEGGN